MLTHRPPNPRPSPPHRSHRQVASPIADRGRLKCARRNLRTLLNDENWKVMENVKLIDEVLGTTERVLNPAAHGGDAPLYEHEVQNALALIARLETCLT